MTDPERTGSGSSRGMLGLDLLRHILILSVIFQHMGSEARYSTEINLYIKQSSLLLDGAVAGFFLLSGFFSRTGFGLRQIRQQVIRLLLPYLFFCAIYGLILAILGKAHLQESVFRTVIGVGVGPHLYFMPYLFLVSMMYAALDHWCRPSARPYLALGLAVALLAAFRAAEVTVATGPDPRLLPLYGAAYIAGASWARFRTLSTDLILTASAGIALVLISHTSPFWDVGLVLVLFRIALLMSEHVLPRVRMPGSGGVYLLHAPLLNHMISTLLMVAGIVSYRNLFATVLLTYVLAISMTLASVQLMPSRRKLLLE